MRFFAILVLLLAGCATSTISPQKPDTIIIVPGITGDTPEYSNVARALERAGCDDCIQVFQWGNGVFMMADNVSSPGIHRDAEDRLAALITQWRDAHPNHQIGIIGHSAGAGVVLGALKQLRPNVIAGPVILTESAVSPQYDLHPALAHANVIHCFQSEKDDFMLKFATTIFGGYDNFHGPQAGLVGFSDENLTDAERAKFIVHPYKSSWSKLGNEGDHYGPMKEQFVISKIAPLLKSPPIIADGNTQSSVANSR